MMIMRLSRFALAVLSTSVLAVFAAACSDPVPPTPQGACHAELLSNGGACTITSQLVDVGSVSATTKDRVLVSGGPESADISCQVTGTTSFNVTGSVSVSGEGVQISIPKIDSSATKMAPAMGSVTFASKESGRAYSSESDAPCAFYFPQGTSQGIASGKIWVTFSCAKVVGGMSTCEIDESVVIFENCTE
jgi:hypothetical protein